MIWSTEVSPHFGCRETNKRSMSVLICSVRPYYIFAGVNISQNSPFFWRGKVSMFWRTREEFGHSARNSRLFNILKNIVREGNLPWFFSFPRTLFFLSNYLCLCKCLSPANAEHFLHLSLSFPGSLNLSWFSPFPGTLFSLINYLFLSKCFSLANAEHFSHCHI